MAQSGRNAALALASDDGVKGIVIGRYKIIEKIGSGAMGMVLKARHETLNRIVALKIMRPEIAQKEDFVQRFLREARTSASVDHPNVVTIYDAGNEQGCLYMAMRFVDGGTLHDQIKVLRRLPEKRALRIMADCLQGVNAVDKVGLVHRDIKPANILIEAESGNALLADLGLARAVRKDDNLTAVGVPMGTPAYMSPEQARGKGGVDIRSDIYAIGVTLYACVTGVVPFRGNSAFETVAMVMYEEPPDPRQFFPELSDQVVSIILKAIRKKPEERYQKPMEMHRDIMAVLEGTAPVTAPIIPASAEAQLARQKSSQSAMFRGQSSDARPTPMPHFPTSAHVAPVGEDSSSGGSPNAGTFTRWLRNLVSGPGGGGNPGSTGLPQAPTGADSLSPGSTGASASLGSNTEELKAQKKKQVRMYRGQIIKDK